MLAGLELFHLTGVAHLAGLEGGHSGFVPVILTGVKRSVAGGTVEATGRVFACPVLLDNARIRVAVAFDTIAVLLARQRAKERAPAFDYVI